jgi:hypothetical protein
MQPFDTLKTSLSDILTFTDSLGTSKSGALRLEIDEAHKKALLSIALPKETNSSMFLLSASAAVFISVLLPSYKKSQTILEESSRRFGAGFDCVIVEKSKEGSLSLFYNRHVFVYELVVELV